MALTPDGRLAVSASADGTLKVWDVASGGMLATYHLRRRAKLHRRWARPGSWRSETMAGRVHFLRLENVVPGAPVVTAWRDRQPYQGSLAGEYRRWPSAAPTAAPGPKFPRPPWARSCPARDCGKPVKLNPFVIEADWRPVAAAWRGEP